jgi:hypothetical protein
LKFADVEIKAIRAEVGHLHAGLVCGVDFFVDGRQLFVTGGGAESRHAP